MATRATSATRRLHQRRINRATTALAVAAATATAVFGLAAAHTTRVSSDTSSGEGSSGSDDLGVIPSAEDDFSSPSLTPSQSAPTQSFGPPVARSGGS